LAEKSAAAQNGAGDHDEHNQADILTSGINLAPALPAFQWLWEFVTRYSGATVPDSHGVPWRMAVISNFQRASNSYAQAEGLPRKKSPNGLVAWSLRRE